MALKTIEIKAESMQEANIKAIALTEIAEKFSGAELKGIASALKIGFVKSEILKQLNAFI